MLRFSSPSPPTNHLALCIPLKSLISRRKLSLCITTTTTTAPVRKSHRKDSFVRFSRWANHNSNSPCSSSLTIPITLRDPVLQGLKLVGQPRQLSDHLDGSQTYQGINNKNTHIAAALPSHTYSTAVTNVTTITSTLHHQTKWKWKPYTFISLPPTSSSYGWSSRLLLTTKLDAFNTVYPLQALTRWIS